MGKKADFKRVMKFRKDFQLLRKKYGNDDIADKMETDAGNLSKYGSGKLNPGEDILRKFYEIYEEELKELRYDPNYMEVKDSMVNEPNTVYASDTEWDTDEHEHLKYNFDKIVETNQMMAESSKLMSESQKKFAESNLTLAKTNEKLIDKLIR